MTASRALGPCTSGRPERGLSKRPGIPRTANRPRQVRPPPRCSPGPGRWARSPSPPLPPARSLARSTSRCGLVPARDDLLQFAAPLDSQPDRHGAGSGLAIRRVSFRMSRLITEECTRNRAGAADIRRCRRAAPDPAPAPRAGRRHWRHAGTAEAPHRPDRGDRGPPRLAAPPGPAGSHHPLARLLRPPDRLGRGRDATSRSRYAASSTSATTTTGASRSTTPPPRPTPTRVLVPGSPPGTPTTPSTPQPSSISSITKGDGQACREPVRDL